uniref:Uncharacterized protein n=1 Tax=Rhizophora mucronata TaxID=61149 RepID=A0A2P2P8P0_RHIMU
MFTTSHWRLSLKLKFPRRDKRLKSDITMAPQLDISLLIIYKAGECTQTQPKFHTEKYNEERIAPGIFMKI